MKKFHIIFTFFLLISISLVACKCGDMRLTPDKYFSYDIIFSGILDTIIGDSRSYERNITFYVSKTYKGDSIPKITFKNTSTGSCHGSYKKGVSYLIYLKYDKKTNTYITSTCNSRFIKAKVNYVNASSIADTAWNYDAIKFRELDFLEKIKAIQTGNIEIKMPNGRLYAKGKMTNGLPNGRWIFFDYDGKRVGSKNYWRGRKFKKAINHSESINFSNQKTGLYAVYLDQSTYTELRINKDGTFDYLTRDMQGIGSTYKGKWRTKGKTLSLKTPQKKDLFRSPIKTWLIKENELCEKYKHKIEPGVCLEYITPVKVISLND